MTVAESVAEKLARYSRIGLARDLYDLCWYSREATLDTELVRRLWVQKVYGDVVVDKRWQRTFEAAAILVPRPIREIRPESIGFLIEPAEIAPWEKEFRDRYAFLAELDGEDRRWAACNPRDKYEFTQLGSAAGQ